MLLPDELCRLQFLFGAKRYARRGGRGGVGSGRVRVVGCGCGVERTAFFISLTAHYRGNNPGLAWLASTPHPTSPPRRRKQTIKEEGQGVRRENQNTTLRALNGPSIKICLAAEHAGLFLFFRELAATDWTVINKQNPVPGCFLT